MGFTPRKRGSPVTFARIPTFNRAGLCVTAPPPPAIVGVALTMPDGEAREWERVRFDRLLMSAGLWVASGDVAGSTSADRPPQAKSLTNRNKEPPPEENAWGEGPLDY